MIFPGESPSFSHNSCTPCRGTTSSVQSLVARPGFIFHCPFFKQDKKPLVEPQTFPPKWPMFSIVAEASISFPALAQPGRAR